MHEYVVVALCAVRDCTSCVWQGYGLQLLDSTLHRVMDPAALVQTNKDRVQQTEKKGYLVALSLSTAASGQLRVVCVRERTLCLWFRALFSRSGHDCWTVRMTPAKPLPSLFT